MLDLGCFFHPSHFYTRVGGTLRALAYNRRPTRLCGSKAASKRRAVQSEPIAVCRVYIDSMLGVRFILRKPTTGPALTAIDRGPLGQ